jgi:2,3-bisphosphoglycerate-dependent phosphoglycerate mutase
LTREIRQLRFEAPPGAARLLLVRHGESAPVRDGVPVPLLEGQSDPELDPVGVEQAERVAERLTGEPIAAIYVTPLRRTAQTAAPLARRLGLEPRVEPGLIEVNLGEWEGGLFRQRVREQHPVAVRMLTEQRWDVIPGAEPMHALARRVRAGVAAIVEAVGPGAVAAAVLHGGVIGELCRQATGSRPLAFVHVDNASVSRLVVFASGRWLLRSFNDTAHLTAD